MDNNMSRARQFADEDDRARRGWWLACLPEGYKSRDRFLLPSEGSDFALIPFPNAHSGPDFTRCPGPASSVSLYAGHSLIPPHSFVHSFTWLSIISRPPVRYTKRPLGHHAYLSTPCPCGHGPGQQSYILMAHAPPRSNPQAAPRCQAWKAQVCWLLRVYCRLQGLLSGRFQQGDDGRVVRCQLPV